MKIALISDVHANLPALESVLADIDARGDVDATYHLGDLVGYAPWPNETIALIRERGISGIAGNYDSTVGHGYKHCGCKYEDAAQEALSHQSFGWTCREATASSKAFLRSLPFRMDIRVAGGHGTGRTLVLVHGTPTLNTLYWTADRSDDFCVQMAGHAGMRSGDVIAFGHTHVPWRRDINEMTFVNTGSVGRPKDRDARAGYALLTLGDVVGWEHVRVSYDLARATAAIRASDLPSEFADYLERGGA